MENADPVYRDKIAAKSLEREKVGPERKGIYQRGRGKKGRRTRANDCEQ